MIMEERLHKESVRQYRFVIRTEYSAASNRESQGRTSSNTPAAGLRMFMNILEQTQT